jgi:hypothetical protein
MKKQNEILMKCRVCKKNYKSNEWKKTGNINGICSEKCRKIHKKRCFPSHLNFLTKDLNKLNLEEK